MQNVRPTIVCRLGRDNSGSPLIEYNSIYLFPGGNCPAYKTWGKTRSRPGNCPAQCNPACKSTRSQRLPKPSTSTPHCYPHPCAFLGTADSRNRVLSAQVLLDFHPCESPWKLRFRPYESPVAHNSLTSDKNSTHH